MRLRNVFSDKLPPNELWKGRYKIPWDDPGFSRRMLREHLSQEHDWASRRSTTIKEHVRWLHQCILHETPSQVLDLGCGPGLYLDLMTRVGHRCCGIDFAPASIEYARSHNSDPLRCEYVQGDLRQVDFGQNQDLVMMLFGELNVFSPEECEQILHKAHCALAPGGRLVLEVHTFEVVKQLGLSPNTWYQAETGLFSDRPHLCLTENHWEEELNIAWQHFYIIDTETEEVDRYRSTVRALTLEEYHRILTGSGFEQIIVHPDWPGENADFILLSGRKA